MAEEPCVNGNINGVPLKEYVELLVRAEVESIRVQLVEQSKAVELAYERHDAVHVAIGKDMEHLNQLRQEVTQDRERLTPLPAFNTYRDSIGEWMKLMGNQMSTLRGQMVGAGFVLGVVFAVIQIIIAIYK